VNKLKYCKSSIKKNKKKYKTGKDKKIYRNAQIENYIDGNRGKIIFLKKVKTDKVKDKREKGR